MLYFCCIGAFILGLLISAVVESCKSIQKMGDEVPESATKEKPEYNFCRIIWICRCCGENNEMEWHEIGDEAQLHRISSEVNAGNSTVVSWVERRKHLVF